MNLSYLDFRKAHIDFKKHTLFMKIIYYESYDSLNLVLLKIGFNHN